MTALRLPILALLGLWFIWGYSWIILKIALRYSGPFDFAALRTLFGALCLLAVLPFTRHPFTPARLRELFRLGLVQTSAFVALSMWALVEGGAGRTAALVFTMPFWTALFAWIFLNERMRGPQWLAAALAAAGLMLILRPWDLAGTTLSKWLALAAGVVWGASAIMVKRFQAHEPMDLLSLTAWQMLFGALPLAVIAWGVPAPPVDWSLTFVLALTFNAVATTAVGWLLWLYVLHHLPAGAAGMSTLAIPVIAIFASWLQLGERPPASELLGMLLIGVALLLLSLHALRQRRDIAALVAPE
ncbi:MAG: DMT family transporter [Chromatiales bacterium]